MSNSQYFPPYLSSNNSDSSEINANLDLTNYTTKTNCNSC